MNERKDKVPENKSPMAANQESKLQKTGSATAQFKDSRPETAQLEQIQELANKSSRPKQLVQLKAMIDNNSARQPQVIQKKNGSHGKAKKLNVKGTYTDGGAATAFNDRDESISIVKGHGGYTNEDALAEAWVRKAYKLSATAVVTITKYNFFTAK